MCLLRLLQRPRLVPARPTVEVLEDRLVPASRLLVQFAPDLAITAAPLPVAGTLGPELSILPGLHIVTLSDSVPVDAALTAFRADPDVVSVEADQQVHLQRTPNDPLFGSQWALNNVGQDAGTPDADIDMPEAWDSAIGNNKTLVAVIDSGIDYRHRDLVGSMWVNKGEVPNNGKDDDGNGYVDDYRGYDFANDDPDPMDDNGHGTHVAGIIGAVGNNGIGVTGVAWRVQLMPLKFLDANGEGSVGDAIEALDYAVRMGASVSNNSWTSDEPDAMLTAAIAAARAKGHIFVAAAGNSSRDLDTSPTYPASINLDNIVTVAATDRNDQLAYFSNWGAKSVDIAAPGVDILSTTPGNTYQSWSGTSMATPFVTGVLALVRERHPEWTYRQVIDQVLKTADPLPALAGKTVSGGRLNANAALTVAVPVAPPVTSGDAGPRITDMQALTDVTGAVNRIQLIFSVPIDERSFTLADVLTLTGPGGVDLTGQVTGVTGSRNRFFVYFTPQTRVGTYEIKLGQEILDLAQRAMDQDRDGIVGEVPGDRFVSTFRIA